jgi:periplasmic nitrate reductase NapD
VSEHLIVCGVLVHAVPGEADGVCRDLNAMPGTEVHERTDDGRLIITVESDSQKKAGDVLIQLQTIPGVAAASLVYHHFE